MSRPIYGSVQAIRRVRRPGNHRMVARLPGWTGVHPGERIG